MHKYLVGTLFEQEEQDKKTNLQNMKAKDPNGNVRWKGAFTGGFEAGFKNTCGSKQGWAPVSFVSSISKRAEKVEQNVLAYMDKDDIGSENISKNISLRADFSTNAKNGLNIGFVQSIGQKIYDKLKRQEAFNSAPQNIKDLHMLLEQYGQQQQIDNNMNYTYYLKDLQFHHSVGDNTAESPDDDFISNYEDFFRKVIRTRAKQETQEEILKRREENKVYFDFTRPLEEEPQYLKEIQQIQDYSKPKKRRKNVINDQSLNHIFGKPIKSKQFQSITPIPQPPQTYDPYHRLRALKSNNQKLIEEYEKKHQEKKPKALNIQRRSDLLGEAKLSDKFTSQKMTTNSFVRAGQNDQSIKKYFEDEKKNQRYTDYVLEVEGKKISGQSEHLHWQQAEKERAEFQKMYKLQQSTKSKLPIAVEKTLENKKGTHDKEITVRRVVTSWAPQKVLCKRFNLLVPH